MALSADKPTSTITLTIPDPLRFWPWPRVLNPHYDVCHKEVSAWFETFKAFSPKAQDAFNRGDFDLLASLGYPFHDRDGCRIGCEAMDLFFLIDEHTDIADPETARAQADTTVDALLNPHKPRPEGEWIGGKVAQQFWSNAIKFVTPSAQRRFIRTFQPYMDAVVQQSVDRNNNHIRDLHSYFEIRRDTIGAKPAFAIMEMYLNIPDEVMEHPVIQILYQASIDLVIISNDLYSYKVECERGDSHNIVTVVMNQFNLDQQAALNYVSDLADRISTEFLDQWKNIPIYGGPLDLEVGKYCKGLAQWVRGNDQWCFESERYFEKEGLKIQASRVIEISRQSIS